MAQSEKTLDMRGRACPEPVIESRRALEDRAITRLSVLVDNDAAAGNVSRTGRNLECTVTVESTIEGEFTVILEREAPAPGSALPKDESPIACGVAEKLVVLFSRETFGEGDPDLGNALLKAFAGVLDKISPRPSTLIFLNGGAKLVCEESPLTTAVKALETAGSEVLVCGTCLDFYNLDKRLQVGTVSNMLDIASTLAAADKIIQP